MLELDSLAAPPLAARLSRSTPVSSDQPLVARQWFKRLLSIAADVSSVLLAYYCGYLVVASALRIHRQPPSGYLAFFACFFAGVLYLFNGYGRLELRRPERELEIAFKAVTYSFLGLLATSLLLFTGTVFSRYLIVLWYLASLVFVAAARFGVRSFYGRLWKAGIARQRVLLIGSPEKLLSYRQLLSLQRCQAYDFVGVVSCDSTPVISPLEPYPASGSVTSWQEAAAQSRAEIIIIDLPTSAKNNEAVLDVARHCMRSNIDVELFSDVLSGNGWNYEFDHFTHCFRLSGTPEWSRQIQRSCKLALDKAVSLCGCGFTLLMTPLVGLLIFLEDPGPIFHRREFVGSDGKLSYYLKFRTMVKDADKILTNSPELKREFASNHKLKNDPRVLRIGRFLRKYSIDEFPQFFSVLSGRLSLVGPRVISREEVSRYGEYFLKRLSVPPGLTGYWQVSGRQNTTYEERIQMDMFYIDHWSIWLDLVIIAKTCLHLVHPEGAY